MVVARVQAGRGGRVAYVVAAFVALSLALTAVDGGAAGKPRYRTRSRRVAPGVRFIRIVDRAGPNRIYVLSVNPARRPTLDVALANGAIPGHETTSSMARRRGAIAAINGDYTIRPGYRGAGRPVNIFARDGRIITSSLIWGRNFAISRDESDVHVGHTELTMLLTDASSSNTWRLASWNDFAPPYGRLGGFAPDAGPDFRPPSEACSVRMYPVGSLRWTPGDMGLVRPFVVDHVRCAAPPLPRKGGTVIAVARTSKEGSSLSRALRRGDEVRLQWSMGWRGVMDTIGGNPTLVERGAIPDFHCTDSYFCDRNPRTGVGVTREGRVLLVTVDGRRPGYSVGLRLEGFARLFKHLGARWALNLDGGGSTTMVVRGRVVNDPSDASGERPVGSSLLVLPGSDPREPSPATRLTGSGDRSASRLLDPPLALQSARLQAVDPASTGGMLDALAHGDLGSGSRIDPSLRPALDAYRRAWQRGRVPPALRAGTFGR